MVTNGFDEPIRHPSDASPNFPIILDHSSEDKMFSAIGENILDSEAKAAYHSKITSKLPNQANEKEEEGKLKKTGELHNDMRGIFGGRPMELDDVEKQDMRKIAPPCRKLSN